MSVVPHPSFGAVADDTIAAMNAQLHDPADPPVNPAVSPDAAPEAPQILIAEDHPDSRDALRSLLEVYGYRVAVAPDGVRAVEKAIALAPDLILMDIMMPEMDGFEATRTLRASSKFRQVPIVALTAMEGAREMVLAAGCDDYLPKPIDVRSFLSRIQHWISTGRPAPS